MRGGVLSRERILSPYVAILDPFAAANNPSSGLRFFLPNLLAGTTLIDAPVSTRKLSLEFLSCAYIKECACSLKLATSEPSGATVRFPD